MEKIVGRSSLRPIIAASFKRSYQTSKKQDHKNQNETYILPFPLLSSQGKYRYVSISMFHISSKKQIGVVKTTIAELRTELGHSKTLVR